MRGGAFVVLALVAGCYSGPVAPRKSEAMERSARMLKALDRLEADLHAVDAEAGVYTELVDRHGHAEQIACRVTDDHLAEIHRLAELQQQKLQAKHRERQRKHKAVAQLAPRNSRS